MSWTQPTGVQAWALLGLAGLLEIAWAVGMKYTAGFSRVAPSIAVFLVATLSFYLLGLAMKVIPLGTAYAVWVGIGAAGAMLLGMLLFNEPASAVRIACTLMIIVGVIGLKIFSTS